MAGRPPHDNPDRPPSHISEGAAKLSQLLQRDPFQSTNEAGRLDDILQRDNKRRQLFINSIPLQQQLGASNNNGASQNQNLGQTDRISPHTTTPYHRSAPSNRTEEATQTFNAPLHSNTTQTHEPSTAPSNQPTPEDITVLVDHHISVEQQLQQQVDYYENALAHLRTRTVNIAMENKKLYEKMNRSVTVVEGDSARGAVGDGDVVEDNGEDDDLPTLDNTADISIASEPGEIKEHPPRNPPASRDTSRQKRVTFDIDNSTNSPDEADVVTNHASTSAPTAETSSFQQINMPLLHLTKPPTSNVQPIAQSTLRVNENADGENRTDLTSNSASSINLSDLTVVDERLTSFAFETEPENLHEETRRLKNIYETKTKHLQLLLKASKKKLQKQDNEITLLKKELRMYRTPVKDGGAEVI